MSQDTYPCAAGVESLDASFQKEIGMRLLSALMVFCSLGYAEVVYPGAGTIAHIADSSKPVSRPRDPFSGGAHNRFQPQHRAATGAAAPSSQMRPRPLLFAWAANSFGRGFLYGCARR